MPRETSDRNFDPEEDYLQPFIDGQTGQQSDGLPSNIEGYFNSVHQFISAVAFSFTTLAFDLEDFFIEFENAQAGQEEDDLDSNEKEDLGVYPLVTPDEEEAEVASSLGEYVCLKYQLHPEEQIGITLNYRVGQGKEPLLVVTAEQALILHNLFDVAIPVLKKANSLLAVIELLDNDNNVQQTIRIPIIQSNLRLANPDLVAVTPPVAKKFRTLKAQLIDLESNLAATQLDEE